MMTYRVDYRRDLASRKNRPIGDNWTEIALFLLFTTVDAEVLKFERYELKISVSNNVLVYLTNKKRISLIR